MAVVNPYAHELTFPDGLTRTGRDHMKFLALIRATTLLYQFQRPVKSVTDAGNIVEYIESTREDVELAGTLITEVLGRSLDELPPQTRRLLLLVDGMVSEQCQRLKMERTDYVSAGATCGATHDGATRSSSATCKSSKNSNI